MRKFQHPTTHICLKEIWLTCDFGENSVQGDVSSKEDLGRIASLIEKEEGKLHILVNNAGIEGPMTKFPAPSSLSAADLSSAHLASESFEEWDKLFRINTSSIFFSTMTFLPLLSASHSHPLSASTQQGKWTASVINITSISGIVKTSQFHYAYNASKAAANHLTQMLAHELRFNSNTAIRVNALAPGLFSSEMTSGGKSDKGKTNPNDVTGHNNPAGRVGSESEYAQLVLLLAANQFITGQIVAVDGGFISAVPSSR